MSHPSQPDVHRSQRTFAALEQCVGSVITGKAEVIASAVTVLAAGGHLLIEDVPGVGKTMLGKALAAAMGTNANRIQFTPDLMPSDITGISLFNQQTRAFEFRPGPVFAHVVIGDEINRASPKTQSALLECMEEGQVSVDGITHHIDPPFLVIATQNPIEMDGTYVIPEAQRDRFMARVSIGYPNPDAEAAMLETHGRHASALLPQAIGVDDVKVLQRDVELVHVAAECKAYLLALVNATRNHPDLVLGASPRASLHLLRAARSHALARGRSYVAPEDIASTFELVCAHRLTLGTQARRAGHTVAHVLHDVLARTPLPRPIPDSV